MNYLGKTIRLVGVSQRGINRVRKYGNMWNVFAETDTILFAPNDHGPWIFVSPIGKDQNHVACHWVRTNNDVNFKIEEV